MSWDALLFDFDGVLADTEPVHYACWREILQPYGIQLDWGFYQKQCIGVSDRLMIHTLAAERVPPIPFEEIWPEYERKQILFRERLEASPPFHVETVELIRNLSAQYKLAVVSSSGRTEVEPPLERAGFRSCFETLVCGREVANLKPAPDPYLKAAELLGARRPLVIEDSEAGVTAGRAAGFEVLRVSDAKSVPTQVRAHLLVR
ncbi:MAG: HAD family phosphatase [Acidobacteriia bacterium]|nr:HAD family phosphatase [Terriglobia bacterium]